MSAASIVIEILAKTASFQTDTDRAGRAMQKLSKTAKESANSIANEFKRVQDAIAKAGMTANQQKIFDLKGLGASQQQLKAYARNLEELDKKTATLAGTNKTLAGSFGAFAGIVGVTSAIGSFSSIIKLSDSYTKFTAQLKLATNGTQEFGVAYRDVQRIAEGSQQSIQAVSTFYSRLANALERFGATQKQVSDITEAFSLSLRVSGSTAAEAEAAMLQFNQGISRGRLEGEEFNSVVGASPRFLKAMQDATGKNLAELKLMNEQGKLGADIIGNALIKSLKDLRTEAEQTKTIEGGFTGVKNQVTLLIGELDQASASSKTLAGIIAGLGGVIKDLRSGDSGFLTKLAAGVPGLIIRSQLPKDESGQTASGKITRAGASDTLQPVAKSFDELAKGLKLVSVELATIKAAEEEVRKSFTDKKINPTQYKELMSALAKEREKLFKVKGPKDDPTKNILSNELAQLERQATKESLILKNRAFYLDTYFKDNILSISEYYASKKDIEQSNTEATISLYDKEIAALNKFKNSTRDKTDIAQTQGKINELLDKREQLLQNSAQASTRLNVEQSSQLRQYEESISNVNAQILELTGNLQAAALIRFDLQNKDLKDRFSAEGNSDALKSLNTLREYTKAQADANKLSIDADIILSQLANSEQRINISREVGAISELSSLKKVDQARKSSVEKLRSLVESYEAVAKASGNPQLLQDADNLRLKLEELEAASDLVAKKFETIFTDSFSDAFSDFISGTKSASEAFQSFANSVVSAINRIAAQEIAQSLFSSFKGSSAGGFLGDLFGSIFSDLPSFDVGTAYVPQDMVANIHKGERILTADENRKFSRGEMGGQTVINGPLMVVNTPNADSFNKSGAQIAATMQRGLNRGRRVT
jgi:tape measure domain-containing protein